MRVYKVTLPKAPPVGVVIEHGKVTIAHPSVGVKPGTSIKDVKQKVKQKKGHIVRVLPPIREKKK